MVTRPVIGPAPPGTWSKEDEIRWVEQRLRERELLRTDPTQPKWCISGEWKEEDYKAWLMHERDELSFQWIGNSLFGTDESLKYGTYNSDPEGRKSKAVRAWKHVKEELSGTRSPLTPTPGQITALLLGR